MLFKAFQIDLRITLASEAEERAGAVEQLKATQVELESKVEEKIKARRLYCMLVFRGAIMCGCSG